jgi:hypothetical protein
MSQIKDRIKETWNLHASYKPLFFRLQQEGDKNKFDALIASPEVAFVHDELESQLKELVKCLNPSRPMNNDELEAEAQRHLQNVTLDAYGVWVYYPWSKTMVHLLDETEFITVRTNRNQLKITKAEQDSLRQKTIGVIGLSVGQSIALTLAMERTCGNIRLADFDTLELSNVNRIRTGVRNLGLSKVVIAAREIVEMDPFINVEIYDKGITAENIQDFLSGNGKMDILVEVCDGLDMKIFSRKAAKEMGIPVVMDTNDRGMLDIERFDLEAERPIMHGLLEGIPTDDLGVLTPEQRMALIMQMVGASSISQKLKISIGEMGKTIGSLPQLASSVVLGGAVTTDVCRRILLDELKVSGRFYVDLDQIIATTKS